MSNEINLITSDPYVIFQDGKNIYKEVSGEEIITSSEDNLILATVSALLGNICAEMNEAATQGYLKYANGVRLDLKGGLYGDIGARLGANAGRATMRCLISQAVARDVVIRKGTRFVHGDYIFKSVEEAIVIQGDTSTDVVAECETKGDISEILAGEIAEIVDEYDYYESCSNITNATGGTDEETDEAYRERIRNIPESMSTAGSEGAYKVLAHSASSLVFDVVVKSPTPNIINIYVTDVQKLISNEEKQKISQFMSADYRRPLNDLVTIKDASLEHYDLNIEYFLYSDFAKSNADIEIDLEGKVRELTKRLRIGEKLNDQDIIAIAKGLGVSRINVTGILVGGVGDTTLLVCGAITLSFGGGD